MLVAVQPVLPVTVNELLPLAADIEKLFMERENDSAGCTAVTCFVMAPDVTVITAVRAAFVVFAAVVIVTVPLLEPDDGETVHHD